MDIKEYAIYLLRGCLIHNLKLTDVPDIDHIEYRTRFLKLTSRDCEIFKNYFFLKCAIVNPRLDFETYLNDFLSALEVNCKSNNFEKVNFEKVNNLPILFVMVIITILFIGMMFYLLKRFCFK
uniref:Uncharacterized protein n=1 Tax=Cacopsylla melanoneura TaxID=428564 RepID=A0A8D8VNC0_9HEMI